MLIQRQVINFNQLKKEGLSERDIKILYLKLKIFPTPFKGIYYVPSEEEKKGEFIDNPIKNLSIAISYFLGSDDFYFSCGTAEENLGLDWHISVIIHIVNTKISKRIDIEKRIERNKAKGNWRSRKIAIILSNYGKKIIFHKVKSIKDAKTKLTMQGRFALITQIKKDKKRFRETG